MPPQKISWFSILLIIIAIVGAIGSLFLTFLWLTILGELQKAFWLPQLTEGTYFNSFSVNWLSNTGLFLLYISNLFICIIVLTKLAQLAFMPAKIKKDAEYERKLWRKFVLILFSIPIITSLILFSTYTYFTKDAIFVRHSPFSEIMLKPEEAVNANFSMTGGKNKYIRLTIYFVNGLSVEIQESYGSSGQNPFVEGLPVLKELYNEFEKMGIVLIENERVKREKGFINLTNYPKKIHN